MSRESSQIRQPQRTEKQVRATLLSDLRARRAEIEQAVLIRVHSISDPEEAPDQEYAEGLRGAVTAALDHGLAAVETGEERAPEVPAVLLVQARLAARTGISLDTVLRRYFAGYSVLTDFIMQKVDGEEPLGAGVVRRIGRDQAAIFDRVLTAVTDEYTREMETRSSSIEERRAERVRRLLAGELLDTTGFAYEFDAWHLGVLAKGTEVGSALREVAKALDRSLLSICGNEDAVWAWLGGRGRLGADQVIAVAESRLPADVTLAVGEAASGLTGWRFTHRQAMAAMRIALHNSVKVVRYSDVALLASVLQDDLLTASLRECYLEPLAEESDGGTTLRDTLRAYFAAERNVSSAAAILGVSRRTVANRLHTVAARIGRPLATALTELDVALRLGEAVAPIGKATAYSGLDEGDGLRGSS